MSGATLYKIFSLQLIKWSNGMPEDLIGTFDVVVSADCLFFDEGRQHFLKCLNDALRPGGIAIVIAPSRTGTFEVLFSINCRTRVATKKSAGLTGGDVKKMLKE
jgi:2-polyprenyl-3-methyl-5-hydroxy-6-metoxy-1,4-benzoquinol methylase